MVLVLSKTLLNFITVKIFSRPLANTETNHVTFPALFNQVTRHCLALWRVL